MSIKSESVAVKNAFGALEVASSLTIASKALISAYKSLRADIEKFPKYRRIILETAGSNVFNNRELRQRVERVVNVAWRKLFTEIAQDKAGRPYIDVSARQSEYAALIMQVLKAQAKLEQVNLAVVLEYLKLTIHHLPESIAEAIKKGRHNSCPPGLYLSVTLLIALVRAKTRRRHGSAILSTKPLVIPLTVQPCAP